MKKTCLHVLLAALTAVPGFAQDFQGSWNGTLHAGGAKLRLVFHIEENNGACAATMDSPDQGAKGIPVTAVTVDGNAVTLKISSLAMTYTGTLAGDTITGTFTQGGFRTALNIGRMNLAQEAAPVPERPQDPREPYPYHSENVTFENKKAGITLAGTLTFPREGKDFPVAVLISGSGPQNRNEEVSRFNHRPFLVLSDYLTRNGIAVLRYDDRGVAESGGDYKTATLDDFAADAMAAFDYLKTRPEINPAKTGLIGHSEGGTIAFLLAAAHPEIAYMVSMAGMTVHGDSLLRAQRYLTGRAQGASDEAIAVNELLIDKVTAATERHTAEYVMKHADSLTAQLLSTEEALIKRLSATLPDDEVSRDVFRDQVKAGIIQLVQPELRSLRQCDPSGALAKIQCPVFALNGEKDLQVPADMNLDPVRALVKSALKVKKYPGLNHLFQHAETGTIDEYGAIEETISPEVLEDIAAWVNQELRVLMAVGASAP
jgi:fermentation-respiration switch protein FrsA (DUF1100 family)